MWLICGDKLLNISQAMLIEKIEEGKIRIVIQGTEHHVKGKTPEQTEQIFKSFVKLVSSTSNLVLD